MPDLSSHFLGIKTPNPFWLASAPPTDKKINVERAFKAGWGGVVWKTLGEEGPPVVNVSSRYSALKLKGQHHLLGMNNIELITDRSLELNLQEISEVKKNWPDRGLIVSIMVPYKKESWKRILEKIHLASADGAELNFGCPHGMSERGMGAAVGQVAEYVEEITGWCKSYSDLPIVVKLTPNITNILVSARAAKAGGADAVVLINTINSITSVDLERMVAFPVVDGKSSHGGYCGPAVKPIALHMVAEIARDSRLCGLPISGIGGIETWRDAAEFISLGCTNVQVCTAAMACGFQIIEDMISGLSHWMDKEGYASLEEFRGKALENLTNWNELNLNYEVKASINEDLCVGCGLCYKVCEDTSHQAISIVKSEKEKVYSVVDKACVGCNLCQMVCPVSGCISMKKLDSGKPYLSWRSHPNNPSLQHPK